MKYIASLIFLLFVFDANSQKNDYNWVVGYWSQEVIGDTLANVQINFNKNPIDFRYFRSKMSLDQYNAVYSDKKGTLQFYTNGCFIIDKNNNKIAKSDSLNFGRIYENNCQFGYPFQSGALFLEYPYNDSIIYLIHQKKTLGSERFIGDERIIITDFLYYTKIVKNRIGEYEVTQKNQLILFDNLAGSQLSACKHTNGKNWWIIQPQWTSNKYFRILLDSSGFRAPQEQQIGVAGKKGSNGGGWACFTPDGKKYIRYSPVDSIFIFDFDRNTGLLSNFKLIPVDLDLEKTQGYSGGCVVSGNSRFLYILTRFKIFQYDLWANDIKSSEEVVAEYDGFESPFPTYFYQGLLAPDCRIYIVPWNGNNILHVIKYPDRKGLACEVKQHAVRFPYGTYNSGTIPYFPNFRLGVTPTYPCDSTINLSTPIFKIPQLNDNLLVYPNPANTEINIKYETENNVKGIISIINIMGQIIMNKSIESNQLLKVDVSDVPNGLYTIRIKVEGIATKTTQVSIIK